MTANTPTFDFAVIGAGIAGASVAAELAGREGAGATRVLLIERESQPGYHTTGRSAALFSVTYGPPVIRALSRASAAFFEAPPAGFAAGPLLSPRGALFVAREDQAAALEEQVAHAPPGIGMPRLDAAGVRQMMPLLREGYATGALFEAQARDIDVHALHHGYLRRLREAGGEIRTGTEVLSLDRVGDAWRIETSQGAVRAGIVVNAAGAWADEIGRMAGAAPIGLVPKRRTALIVAAPAGVDVAGLPMVLDVDEQFYLKPDAGRLLISPADETPSPPCDAQPEEMDVAICVDRIERAFDMSVRRIETKWAGLRSFVADKAPVAGFAPGLPGFFWLAGQGGYGIQSAPALSRTAAALASGAAIPSNIADQGVRAADLAPGRAAAG